MVYVYLNQFSILLFKTKAMTRIKNELQKELYPGEAIVGEYQEPPINYLCPFYGPLSGALFLTNYRIFFKNFDPSNSVTIDVPLCTISKLEKVGGVSSKGENSYGMIIYCKDLRNLRFAHKQEDHSRRDPFKKLQLYAFPLTFSSEKLFAFLYKAAGPTFTFNDGWKLYDPISEYKRLKISPNVWRIKKNEGFQLCDTYPYLLIVPYFASDDLLRKVANFRSKGRLPVLSWANPRNEASIVRCSQPLVGVSGKRSVDDEKYIEMVMSTNEKSQKIYIMDARSKANAMANKARGGGYENEENYANVEIVFLDIPNIHVVRESFRKLKDACFSSSDEKRLFSNVESSCWLEYIKTIIKGAVKIADKVETCKCSVIVHCSDGWDRTSQLTSLVMLMLDPYYRTIIGFEVLIEKEWISFGHKFSQRIGHGEDKYNDAERSPIFVQFIDCVWQLTNQFPSAFEFNEKFLITILDHLYSCLFGTFLCNSELQRNNQQIRLKTVSLWSFINSNVNSFINSLYCLEIQKSILWPKACHRNLNLWKNYYCRWSVHNPIDISLLDHHQTEMKKRIKDIKKTLNVLENDLKLRFFSRFYNSKLFSSLFTSSSLSTSSSASSSSSSSSALSSTSSSSSASSSVRATTTRTSTTRIDSSPSKLCGTSV